MAQAPNILDPYLANIYPQIPPEQQRQGVDVLKAKCTAIEGAGSTEAQLAMMGQSDAISLPEDKRRAIVAGGLDQCYWQLSMFLRYSTPSRIAEATPYLKSVLAHFAVEKPGETDVVPLLYLGVALHKVPGEESAALNAFTTAFDHGVDVGSTSTMLWARGCMSRLLRRLGKIQEAEQQESEIRDWLRWHKFGMPQSEFINLVTDPDHEGEDHVMDHPEMQKLFEGVVDLGNGMAIHFG
ncbi:hypothetical protein JOM56_009229 [Amanita muscaria]